MESIDGAAPFPILRSMNQERRSPAYSIVIPAYNEAGQLPQTLRAAREAMESVAAPGEIIVADNNSTDRTPEIARVHGARVVFEPHNQISRARNTGARSARGSLLLFLDADTHLPPALLQQALHLLQAGETVGGGAQVSFDVPVAWSGRRGLALWNWISRRFQLAAGSCIFVRRDAFEAIGGFSEAVYAGEEIGLSRALQRYGRANGMRFRILEAPPVVTSARKLEWNAPWKVLLLFLWHVLVPFSIRSRKYCGFWYKRPGGEPGGASHDPGPRG